MNENNQPSQEATDMPEAKQTGAVAETESFEMLLEQSLSNRKMKVEEVATGTILQITPDYVIVDVGYKSEGQIPIEEFKDYNNQVTVQEGDKIDVFIEGWENENGMMVLSKEKADRMKVWDRVSRVFENEETIEGRIISRIKGGLAVDIGLKAFLPGSQIDLHPVRDLDKLIGVNYEFKILKLSRKRGNIVLSRRAILEKERESMRAETIKKITEGAVAGGIVKNITDYGVFIDLGGVDGLLHVTDISWGRITSPHEYFNIGDKVEVKILSFDRETQRVALGYKQLRQNPWELVEQKYPIGTKITGKVVNITNYGCFIEIEEGVEGLIHISEMSWTKKVKHPSQLLSIGDIIEAMVLDMDINRKRISLGLKQLEPNPWTVIEDRYPVGTVVEGKIKNITDFGIFIGLDEGIDGLVHISDISWVQKIKHPAERYKKGDMVKAVVLSIDKDNERFSLGIKQLEPDPWEDVANKYRRGQVVKGVVTNTTDFGIFLELEEGIEGLVHVSEISDDKGKNLQEVASVGDALEVLIISIDKRNRKIGLSLRELHQNQDVLEMQHYMDNQKSGTGATLGDLMNGALNSRASHETPPAPSAEPVVGEAVEAAEGTATETGASHEIPADAGSQDTTVAAAENDADGTDAPAAEEDADGTDAPKED